MPPPDPPDLDPVSGRPAERSTPRPHGRPASIAVLRESLRGAEADLASDRALERWVAEVADDPRAGVRSLLRRAERQLASRAAERERLARLFSFRRGLALPPAAQQDEARGLFVASNAARATREAEAVATPAAPAVAGVDEVGVGPLAGSVVAAAVALPDALPPAALHALRGLDDSKRVKPLERERLAGEIRRLAVGVGIGEVGSEEIDQRGIYHAALEAMRRSLASLARTTRIAHVLVDARTIPGVDVPQTAIVKGDQKDAGIAAASIVAKVHRDAQMCRMGERYPAYGFERHMGYGTAEHLAALERVGPCPIHRRSFAPVAAAIRDDGRVRARPIGSAPGAPASPR